MPKQTKNRTPEERMDDIEARLARVERIVKGLTKPAAEAPPRVEPEPNLDTRVSIPQATSSSSGRKVGRMLLV